MPYSHAVVDIDKLPEDIKEMVIHIAQRHNALVMGTNEIKTEIDKITGKTPEEKAEMHNAFGKMKLLVHWVHSKKIDGTLALLAIYMLTSLAKALGFNLTFVGPFIEKFIHTFIGL